MTKQSELQAEYNDLLALQDQVSHVTIERALNAVGLALEAVADVSSALEPFAKLADVAHQDHRDSRPFIFAFDTTVAQRLTIGDLRKARAALTGEDKS